MEITQKPGKIGKASKRCILFSGMLGVFVLTGCVGSTEKTDTAESLGTEPTATDSLGIETLAAKPTATDSLGTEILPTETTTDEFWKNGHKATIVRVVDGDTVILDFGADIKRATARLIGINTPEVKSGYTFEQCFGPHASARLKLLVQEESEVYVLTDIDPLDKYDRLLVYLFRRSDGRFINKLMLEEGYARTLTIAPNDAFDRDFKTAESLAKTNKRGLWEACKEYN